MPRRRPHSLSGERRPDFVVTLDNGRLGNRWVVLDAKYRAGRENLASGLASVASLSFAAVAGRRLRVQAGFTALPAGSSTFEVPIVLDGATTIGGGFAGTTDVATPVNAEALFSTSTGSHTVEVFTNVAGGANVGVGVNATATVPVFIIEDVGPSGAPA